MTREEIKDLALDKIKHNKYLILELITGFGKSKLAIDLINYICDKVYNNEKEPTSVLILVAKTVHKQTWIDEIKKWGGIKTDDITIECYESLKKYKNQYFDTVIADEAQHLSKNRLEILESLHINEAFIGLSATIKNELRSYFGYVHNASFIKCGLKEAVENNILPEPKVYLLPMQLDNYTCNYKTKKYGKDIIVTQKGYYKTLSSLIDWYKEKYFNSRSERVKNLWLSTADKRLKWLSEQKEDIVLNLLDKFKNQRTITFCKSIDQSVRLGKYNITSKNKNSTKYLTMFNDNKIKHITAVNILNEGVNLTNCRVGIFCNLNSSEIISKQRVGRLLRHKKPIIILPYFKETREEELINKMIKEYNKNSVVTINNINSIIL